MMKILRVRYEMFIEVGYRWNIKWLRVVCAGMDEQKKNTVSTLALL